MRSVSIVLVYDAPTMPPTTTPTPIAASSDTDRYLEWCALAGVLATLLAGQAWALWTSAWDAECRDTDCQTLASFTVGVAAMLILGLPAGWRRRPQQIDGVARPCGRRAQRHRPHLAGRSRMDVGDEADGLTHVGLWWRRRHRSIGLKAVPTVRSGQKGRSCRLHVSITPCAVATALALSAMQVAAETIDRETMDEYVCRNPNALFVDVGTLGEDWHLRIDNGVDPVLIVPLRSAMRKGMRQSALKLLERSISDSRVLGSSTVRTTQVPFLQTHCQQFEWREESFLLLSEVEKREPDLTKLAKGIRRMDYPCSRASDTLYRGLSSNYPTYLVQCSEERYSISTIPQREEIYVVDCPLLEATADKGSCEWQPFPRQ